MSDNERPRDRYRERDSRREPREAREGAGTPQSDAIDRAVHESAAAGAMPPAIVPDHPLGEMIAKAADVAATEAEVVTIEDAVATTGEEAGTTVPTLATAHHNHPKAHEPASVVHLAVLESLLLVLAPQSTHPSRKRHPMWR
ncbi:hypothetical protein P3342_009725 [Pyrenophora teres f. teres]|nr:hypothetical protein P3342_009725 [Pyrenophora teres f. teres]